MSKKKILSVALISVLTVFVFCLPHFFLYLQHELSHEIYNCHWRDSERTCALLRATSRTFRMASAQHGA